MGIGMICTCEVVQKLKIQEILDCKGPSKTLKHYPKAQRMNYIKHITKLMGIGVNSTDKVY